MFVSHNRHGNAFVPGRVVGRIAAASKDRSSITIGSASRDDFVCAEQVVHSVVRDRLVSNLLICQGSVGNSLKCMGRWTLLEVIAFHVLRVVIKDQGH